MSFVVAAALARDGATSEDESVWVVAVLGGVIGGIAAGILLTASGSCFSFASRDYAMACLSRDGGGTAGSKTFETPAFRDTWQAFSSARKLSANLASLIVYLTATWTWMAVLFLCISLLSALGMTRVRSVAATTCKYPRPLVLARMGITLHRTVTATPQPCLALSRTGSPGCKPCQAPLVSTASAMRVMGAWVETQGSSSRVESACLSALHCPT